VKVVDLLSRRGSHVGDQPIPSVDTCLGGRVHNKAHHCAGVRAVRNEVVKSIVMLPRDNKKVRFCHRVQILEGKEVFITVDLCGWNVTRRNPAEDTCRAHRVQAIARVGLGLEGILESTG
jgi:hypothetical protein